MIRRTLFIAVSVYCTIFACNGLTTPPIGPGTEYPCGVWGVVCSTSKQSAMCCPQNHICGYDGAFSRCQAGLCCYDGDDWPNGLASDGGSDAGKESRPLPQYKVVSSYGSGQ